MNQIRIASGDLQKLLFRSESGLLDRLGDVEHRVALGDHNGVRVDVAPREPVVNVDQSRRLLKQVFARFE